MAHYYVGDIPSEDLVIEPARDGEPIDLGNFATVGVELVDPAGVAVPSSGFTGSILGDTVIIEWPGESVLDLPGLYALRVTLESTTANERLAAVFLVVEQEDGWATLDQARADWPDAQQISDIKLWRLLEVARMQILEKAPTLEAGVRPPLSYVEGQLMQARNIWNAGRVSPSGEVGGDNFAITPHPVDWWVLQMIRPARGIPVVG